MKPTFLFIGPDKSGSSWLFEVLSNHPQVYVPLCKDIYFFDKNYHRSLKWYCSFFDNSAASVKEIGEISHDYLFCKQAAARISRDLPGVKLLTCLRNPVERTFSQYLFFIRSGMTRVPFEEALGRFPELIDNSLYFKHLSEYYKFFAPSSIRVLIFDDFKADPISFARDIFEFLQISFVESSALTRRVLPSSYPRQYTLAKIAKLAAHLIRYLGFLNLLGKVKSNQLVKNFLYKPYDITNRPVISPPVKAYLLNIFKNDIKKLEDLIRRDLSHWYIEKEKEVHH